MNTTTVAATEEHQISRLAARIMEEALGCGVRPLPGDTRLCDATCRKADTTQCPFAGHVHGLCAKFRPKHMPEAKLIEAAIDAYPSAEVVELQRQHHLAMRAAA